MKKILMAVLAIAFALVSADAAIQGEVTKNCRKAAEKGAKTQAKQIKKEKWSYAGAMPLQDALADFLINTGACGAYEEKVVETNDIKYVSTGEKSLMNRVCGEVVAECNNEIMGSSASSESLNGSTGDRFEQDKQVSKYRGQLSGCVKRAFTLTRKENSGLYTVRAYFLIDKEKKEALMNNMSNDYKKVEERAQNIKDTVKKDFEDSDK